MRIAINTRLLISNKMEGIGWYTYEVVKRIVETHPEDDFILFFDRKPSSEFDFGPNAKQVILSPQARHPFLFKIWFNWSIKRAIKKYKPDVFFSPDGYLSLTVKIPQVPVIHDLNFEHYPEDLPRHFLKYYKSYFPKFADVSDHILTVSEYSRRDIAETYDISLDKITVVWNGASDIFSPLPNITKENIREKYTNGKPYFLFVGALHPRKNLRRLIEAYSIFRNENPDNVMELVVVGTDLWKNSSGDIIISENIKDSIHFTGHLSLEELSKLMGAANIFVFVPYFEGFGIPIVEAMKAGVPIITGNRTSLPEVGGDAALYCDPFDSMDISRKMKQLAEDPDLQLELKERGLERAKKFSWDETARRVYEVLSMYRREKS